MQRKQEDLDSRKEDDVNYKCVVSRAMAVNDLVCEDINDGSLDFWCLQWWRKHGDMSTQGGVAPTMLAIMKMADSNFASRTRRGTSSISMSDGKVLMITGTATLWSSGKSWKLSRSKSPDSVWLWIHMEKLSLAYEVWRQYFYCSSGSSSACTCCEI